MLRALRHRIARVAVAVLPIVVAGCGGPADGNGPLPVAADLRAASPGADSAAAPVADLGSAGAPDLSREEPPDLAATRDAATGGGPDLAAAGYPAGPNGGSVGSTLPDFSYQGYFAGTRTSGLASAVPYGTVRFAQTRGVGARYLMVMLAGYS